MIQGSDEWHKARLGRVTASNIDKVMMAPSTAGYQAYMAQLICERLTGQAVETFQSAAMLHGIETEPQARARYIMATGHMVQEVGFIENGKDAGASPDGLVGEIGLVEIKCPQPAEHIRTLTGGEIKKAYRLQMIWQLECTGREWCDFVSFCPFLPDELQLHVERFEPDREERVAVDRAVSGFVLAMRKKLDTLSILRAAAA